MTPFYFERTITIARPGIRAGTAPVGKQGYGGSSRADEVVRYTDIPASIQYSATARTTGVQLPSDARVLTDWKIIVPVGYLPDDAVDERDIVTSDLGKRYQVLAARPSRLGFQMRASLLQV